MQEAVFLKRNADKWKKFEAFLSGKGRPEPDQLAELFVQLTDDLSYAKTYYPRSNTARYLNALTAKAHQAIYRNKKEPGSRLLNFWRTELPGVMAGARKELFYSLAILSTATIIGIVSSAHDDSFVRVILGDSYVNMTLENISNNDPLAVYKKMNALDMFLGITFNNIQVSFLAFTAGVLLSFGTGWILFQNGVMLGAFHYFFYAKGLLGTALSIIWIHGTLEISAIVVAGAAGLVIGNSILFPGTYSRRQSFMLGAKKGLKMVAGLIPIFIVAGFLEGFVTRHTDMPVALSLTIILGSFCFVLVYFIIYPQHLRVNANGPD